MLPIESEGASLWGTSLYTDKKTSVFDVDIDEDAVAAMSGICIDALASSENFRAAVIVKSNPDREENKAKEITVACVSAGCSENVSLEIPLYKGDQVICRAKAGTKGKIHIFGSVATIPDVGDVMESEYALTPEARLNAATSDTIVADADTDEDSDYVEETVTKPTKTEEPKADTSEEDSDSEDEGVKLLEEKFKGRTVKKRKMSESSNTSEPTTKKKSKSEVSEESVIDNVKTWIKEEGKQIALPDLGSKFVSSYKKGFKKLGFGKSMSKFLQDSGEFNVEGGNVSLK